MKTASRPNPGRYVQHTRARVAFRRGPKHRTSRITPLLRDGLCTGYRPWCQSWNCTIYSGTAALRCNCAMLSVLPLTTSTNPDDLNCTPGQIFHGSIASTVGTYVRTQEGQGRCFFVPAVESALAHRKRRHTSEHRSSVQPAAATMNLQTLSRASQKKTCETTRTQQLPSGKRWDNFKAHDS